jgi:hypothetical protein
LEDAEKIPSPRYILLKIYNDTAPGKARLAAWGNASLFD